MRRVGLVLACGVTIVATALMGAGGAFAQESTTTTGATATTAAGGGGTSTNGNAKAAKTVKNDPLTGTPGSGLTRGVTSDSVKVGCYLTQSAFQGADDGFKARFERANKDGELPGGRKIDFSACQDDGNNPQTNLQIVQKLVQQEGDFAIVGISPNVLTASTDFVGRNQVPMYGWGILPGECGNRWFFGFNGCLVTNYPGKKHTVYQANLALGPMEAVGQTPAESKFALQAQDNDTGHSGNETISQLVKLEGAKVVYNEANIPASSAGTSFTPFVEAIKAANPNILLTLTDFQTAPGLTAAVTAGGYTGANVNYVGYIPGLLDSSSQLAAAFDGAYVSSQTVPSEENTPYIKQMQEDLTAANAKTGSFITLANSIAYAEADLLVSQLKAAGKNLNTKTFDQKMNGGNYTYRPSADGGPGQMEYPSMHFIPADCASMLKIEGTTYKQIVPFKCYPSLVKKG
jgi:ABC-type branched-subunit amino acid transport system substrate-binding protein